MKFELLETIDSPLCLKNLSIPQLNQLATEIRHRIIDVLSANGGHLASNLGAVELTIALHKVFNAPLDKFIWDVSHQTYTHKLLTGRNEKFDKIRKYHGLCGFTHPKESEYDHFHAGHAGTALSLALGVAKTRDLCKHEDYVIPIIGDATLTCGMSLEALNNISRELNRFIVVLNDNAMSISKNVGAITHILSRILSNPTTNRLLHDLDSLVSKIPNVGSYLCKQVHKIAESLKNLVSPAAFFEEFGLTYIGPIDGHDIKKLIDTFEGIKDSSWPIIVHVLTNKGQGMNAAIENPTSYHGAKPFNRATGKFLPVTSVKPTFPNIFGEEILKMADEDEKIVVVTPAMSAGSCLDALMKKYPDRCFDVGIAESHAVTFAGGLAFDGEMRVVISIYSSFLQRAFDNLFHDICLQEFPVVFAIDRAGLAGGDGATHNGIYDISFLNAMPNMVICQPRNGKVLRELLRSAFAYNYPTAIRYPNLSAGDEEKEEEKLATRALGKAEIISEGTTLLIIALGHMCQLAIEVKEKLRQYGVEATVLDPIFIKPLDSELLCRLFMTHSYVVTIEEHAVNCGLGAIINNFLLKNGYNDIQVLNFGIPEAYIEQGSHKELMEEIGLTAENITPKITRLLAFQTEEQLSQAF